MKKFKDKVIPNINITGCILLHWVSGGGGYTENTAHRMRTKERNGWLSHLLVPGKMLGGSRL